MPRTVILHYHLYKNAGTSLDAILKRNFPDRWHAFEINGKGIDHSAAVAEQIRAHPDCVAFSSHTALGPLPEIEDTTIISLLLLRDPIARLRSVYRFERKQNFEGRAKLAKEKSFEGYVGARLATVGDRQCRNFHLHRLARFAPGNASERDRAHMGLRQLSLVGVVEEFDRFLSSLTQILRPLFPAFEAENIALNTTTTETELPSDADAAVNRLLSEINADDIELWQTVRERIVETPPGARPYHPVPVARSSPAPPDTQPKARKKPEIISRRPETGAMQLTPLDETILREENCWLLPLGTSRFITGDQADQGAELSHLIFEFGAHQALKNYRFSVAVYYRNIRISNGYIDQNNSSFSVPVSYNAHRALISFIIENRRFSVADGNDDSFLISHPLRLVDFRITPCNDPMGNRKFLLQTATLITNSRGLSDETIDDETRSLVLEKIISRLSDGKGFSFIRLGDGEGRILGYPDYFTEQELVDQVLNYQFGAMSMMLARQRDLTGWIDKAAGFMSDFLREAITQADFVGLPVTSHVNSKDKFDQYGRLGYTVCLFLVSALRKWDPPIGADFFQIEARDGWLLKTVAPKARTIYTIGPWDLTAQLTRHLGVSDVRHIQVPRHATWSGTGQTYGQYPDLYKYVEQKIRQIDTPQGCVFLIGAGIFGKYYCNLIKEIGGIALDIGSVFDSWKGEGLPYAVENQNINII